MKPQPKCPMCHKPPEMASCTAYLYVHFCEASQSVLYTNGLLWSTERKEITVVHRSRVVHDAGQAGENRQTASQVVPLQRPIGGEDRKSPA